MLKNSMSSNIKILILLFCASSFITIQAEVKTPDNGTSTIAKHESLPHLSSTDVKNETIAESATTTKQQTTQKQDGTSSAKTQKPTEAPTTPHASSSNPPFTVTVIPESSAAPIITTTPKVAERGEWNIVDPKTNITCIRLVSTIHIDIPYKKKDNHTDIGHVHVPSNAKASGTCDKNNQVIELKWLEPNDILKVESSNLTLTFAKDDSEKVFTLFAVKANIAVDNKTFPNITDDIHSISVFATNLTEFRTSLHNSYLCKKEKDLQLSKYLNETSTIKFKDLQFQAFRESKDTKFDTAIDCEALVTPDIVPIVVGCTLALLVIVVLVAYLIGRKRAQARGYLSM